MTDEEALALKPGDRVYDHGSRTGRFMVVSVARHVPWPPRMVEVYARREGFKRNGKRYNGEWLFPRRLQFVSNFELLTANVYADWLDGRGEARAADLLRRAFPIDPGAAPGHADA